MRRRDRAQLAAGVLLILAGAWFLAGQFFPALTDWIYAELTWPFAVIGVGLVLMLFGLLGGIPAMAIPACIVTGIGAILYWQNRAGDFESWTYVWTLIPGFVGVGILIAGLLGSDRRGAFSGGLWLIFISLILFAIFGSFLGGLAIIGMYWPVLLILLGLMVLARAFFRPQVE